MSMIQGDRCHGRVVVWAVALSAMWTYSCTGAQDDSSGESAYRIEDETLSGRINGMDWRFSVGLTDPSLEADDETVHYVSLFAESDARCDNRPLDAPHVIVTVPKQVGQFALGPALNATFAYRDGSQDIYRATFDGALVITEYSESADTFSGALIAKRNGVGEVNGTFTVTVCPTP